MTHSDLASFLSRTFLRQAAFRAFILPAMVALSAVFTAPHAWATAAPTTTALTITSAGSEATSVTAGTVVTLTATVVSGSTPVNPGQVKFCDASTKYCEDSALLATAQLTKAGIATYKFRPGIGSHSYQAVFVGTKSYAKNDSTTADLTVTPSTKTYPTATTIASSGTLGNYTLSATVAGTVGIPLSLTGNVSFLDTSNGNASLGTASLGTAALTESFTTASMPSVGTSPDSVVTGDFNGDGIPDLATANNSDNIVTVLLGNGDGTFTLKSSPGVGNNPVSVTVGDFNGDGILDLAVANQDDNTVTVLLGNGDGTFTTKSTLSVGNGPDSISTADFNLDGISDLVVANGGDNTVSVLLGRGDGTFTLNSSPAVGKDPTSVAVADFNGDGVPDLATSNKTDNTVTVLLGKGDGTFTLKSSPGTGYNPVAIAVGDFNGDGIPDLVTAENTTLTDDLLTVLLGNGDGTFTAAPQIYGWYARSVSVGDFNGDGIPDLVTDAFANEPSYPGLPALVPATLLFLGNGDGTFTLQSPPAIYFWPSPGSIAVADFNGDGSPDVAVGGGGPSQVSVMLNQFTETATATLNSVSTPVSSGEIHQVEASYPGDTNYNSSTSSTVPLLAAQIATTLNLSSSASSIVAGNTITLTATLSPYSLETFNTNGEIVTFYDGTTNIGTGTLSSGMATLNTAYLPVGTNTLTAKYSGDTNFIGSTSGTVVLTVSQVVTTLNLSSSPNPSNYESPITLTAALSPFHSGGFTTNNSEETATFYNGATVLGTATLYAGAATLNVASLPGGTDTLTAVYPGDGIFLAATSNSVVQTVLRPAPTPTFTPASGFYPSAQMVSIMNTAPGAKIYYTTDRTAPTVNSTLYSGPISISSSTQLQAIAVAPNYTPSLVAIGDFYIATAKPVISVPSGTYTSTQMVSIADATPGAVIYYTTDGTTPSRSSPVFNPMNPIVVNASETIKAYALAPGYNTSSESVANYNIIPPYAPTPTFSLAGGFYNSSVMVSIMDSLQGATIHYTTDHTMPTASSPVYGGGPITINNTERLQAIAVAPNYSPSAVALSDYYIATVEPVISLPSGTYTSPQMVTITDSTPGAVIYYTIDGTVPNRASPTISPGGSITVSASETLKAIAVAAGYTASPQAAAWYTITP
jgi:Bacterial Ig-like domain (group 3)/Chitobiase/beta-hexosaminidase C-terminal domain/FG-GAP-like repeat/FG-GAP repeat